MSVHIIHLVSGEQVISKVTELKTNEGEPMCFLFAMPMSLNIVPGETEGDNQINYFPWSPFSGSKEFKVGFEKVITIGDPTRDVFEKYIEITQPLYPILSPQEFESFVKSKQEKQNNE